MAENALTVVGADNLTHPLRSSGLGGGADPAAQWALIAEAREGGVDPTGGTIRHTVTSAAAAVLDPPTVVDPASGGFVPGVYYARIRVFETVDKGVTPRRLYYRQDGTPPNNTGTNATGFVLHAEAFFVKLEDFTKFGMRADVNDAGSFEVYVEWLTLPPT